jgi:hypothetical protein
MTINKRDHTGGWDCFNGNKFCVAAGRDGVALPMMSTRSYCQRNAMIWWGNTSWKTYPNIPGKGRSGAVYGTTCDGELIVVCSEGFIQQGLEGCDRF